MCQRSYLLPPIIFYAGLSVKKKQFFRNFLTISSFGIVGTYVAFATVALVLYALSKLPNFLKLSVSRALQYGKTFPKISLSALAQACSSHLHICRALSHVATMSCSRSAYVCCN